MRTIKTILFTLACVFAMTVHADNYYLSSLADTVIRKFDAQGNASDFATGVHAGLAFGPNGNLYAADNHSIVSYDQAGHSTVFATGFVSLRGLGFDSFGSLYAVEFNDTYGNPELVYKITPQGTRSMFGSSFTGIDPVGLAVDPANNVYVGTVNGIYKINQQGQTSLFASAVVSGLACDKYGVLFSSQTVGHSTSNSILKFDPQGHSSLFANLGAAGGGGIAVDSDGNVFAAITTTNYLNNYIEKFDPQGHGSVFALTGLRVGSFLAIQQIPEPGTFALAVGSLAAVIASGRRTRPRSG